MAIQNQFQLHVKLCALISSFAAHCPWRKQEAIHMPSYPRHMLPLYYFQASFLKGVGVTLLF